MMGHRGRSSGEEWDAFSRRSRHLGDAMVNVRDWWKAATTLVLW